ncbi:abortive infection protein, putative (plasmid) [Emticicia oligotrophica DSM 17448]|uniref:Abortive infection protein, putative n=1 Tax=Emticicia oligotrophica (strain DSM 17448 / CIP 109782 / MTCC 6937 / GPTSA100-15) TaxID=929562 RepID=A0ABM5N7X6_EMTOG|nr:ATP-binding protein [Emticicia oligotrophica]AFK05521.1 abortive infection protein, putative [Emticicia oligotrophica DSM 17448]
MLLQFSIKNFRTFKDKATLSLIASNYDKETREHENIVINENFCLRLLKSAVIYGANASGKSKLLDAFAFMRYFVINSSKESQKGETIEVEPFRLSTETENEPSEFEIIFIHNKVLYRYGFEATTEKIVSEWLYHKPKTKEVELFYRDGSIFNIHERSFTKGNTVVKEGLVRDNALLISVAAQFNEKTAINVLDWFKRLKTLSGLNESGYQGFTMGKAESSEHKHKILELLKAADLGIQDIKMQKLDIDSLPKDLPKELRDKLIREIKEDNAEFFSDVSTTHRKFDVNKNAVSFEYFSLENDESSGTSKFFALTGPILDVIENGYILVVDELDSKLHPNLVCKVVSLFNSKEFNKKNAQLIFNTHETNLLSSGLFRRDQIWFTNKNKYGEAKLYSLADFKSDEVRKNDPFEDNYIKGKYGAVPFLGFFDNLKFLLTENENEGQKS